MDAVTQRARRDVNYSAHRWKYMGRGRKFRDAPVCFVTETNKRTKARIWGGLVGDTKDLLRIFFFSEKHSLSFIMIVICT